jgi:uncharacterized membrane protein
MNRLRTLWWAVSGSLWFLPSVIVLAALILATVLIELETRLQLDLARDWPRLFGAGADGARSMLSAIAGSMITVAGVVFSVTLVALTLAATQYSPRVIRTFMSDRPTQAVLGVFVAVFAYCVVVLRSIRSESEDSGGLFVPSLAVFGGMVLALIAIGFLVFFIHHLAVAIDASSILARLTDATSKVLDQLFPAQCRAAEEFDDTGECEERSVSHWIGIPARRSGYVVSVDTQRLLQFADRIGRILRMDLQTGDFAIEGSTIASLSPGPSPSESECATFNACYVMEPVRTLEQDAAFGIQQVVDIALKALSPGINDQTTAVMCIDRLAELTARIADRRLQYRYRRVDEHLRLIAASPSFDRLLCLAFNDILQHAGRNRTVLERLRWAMRRVRDATKEPSRVGAVGRLENCIEVALQEAP